MDTAVVVDISEPNFSPSSAVATALKCYFCRLTKHAGQDSTGHGCDSIARLPERREGGRERGTEREAREEARNLGGALPQLEGLNRAKRDETRGWRGGGGREKERRRERGLA